jgi:glycosyltransferase involved in cell wall biosynthesis
MRAPLNIVFLTPGTGGWHCGACMRDNALARSLHAADHRVSMLPMYLPLTLDEPPLERAAGPPVFFGGINLFLQHKFPWFRRAPRWMDTLLDHPRLLRWVARRSHMTDASGQGEMTLAMLRPGQGGLDKEMAKLLDWLQHENPDVICLSTALQAGMIRSIKQRIHAKVICCFQGEHGFLDSLPQPWRGDCWREMAACLRDADARIAPSKFYAEWMAQRLDPSPGAITVMPNGIDLTGYAPVAAKTGPPTIGFLARMSREKGLDVMVDAFIHLRNRLGHPDARLHLAGAATAENQPLLVELKQRIEAAGLGDAVVWQPDLSREDKAAMLRELSLFSVPAACAEAFGLYLPEAMASGVPVVQPACASFPEILTDTDCGVLVTPGDPLALAKAWHGLLGMPTELARMAAAARRAAEQFYNITVMRDRFVALADSLIHPTDHAHSNH